MELQYLKLPLRFAQYFDRGHLDRCGLKESIARNLHLLITTTEGENLQNDRYGCRFWDDDYDIHQSADTRRDAVIRSVKDQIARFEKRLESVNVEVNVRQREVPGPSNTQLRYRIEIAIRGLITRNKEPFLFRSGFFVGPLLLD